MNITSHNLFSIVLLAVALTLPAGCVSRRVTDASSLSKVEAVYRINRLLNQGEDFHIGNVTLADDSGFKAPDYYGRGVRRSYAEIVAVEETKTLGGLLFLGVADPTSLSWVTLTYADTSTEVVQRALIGSYWSIFPFYLFRPAWFEVGHAAKGFERMRLLPAEGRK